MNIILVVLKFILCLCVFGFLVCGFALLKNNNTYSQQVKITHAIGKWKRFNPNISLAEFTEMLDSMKDYDETFHRLFDWGHKNILPPDKYELIKPWIDE